MPETFRHQSIKVLGYIAKPTLINQQYITTLTIQNMLEKGMSPERIARTWNQGNDSPCKSGTNSKGVKFNSCQYVATVINNLN